MLEKPKISISWSGGKDSALAFHKVKQSNEFQIVGLHTVFDIDTKRVSIHNVPEHFIEAQAKELGLPLTKLYLPRRPMAYQKLMTNYYKKLKSEGVDYVMFGDIFLEDLKDFRETILKASGVNSVYPLWQKDTSGLVLEFLELGFQTVLCALDSKFIGSKNCGKLISSTFIENHSDIDPCGENGEYHSFVVDGPIFNSKISVAVNRIYAQEHFFKVKDENGVESKMEELFYYADLELLSKS